MQLRYIVLFLCLSSVLSAQEAVVGLRMETKTFHLDKKTTATFKYMVIDNVNAYKKMMEDEPASEAFPLVLVKKAPFMPVLNMIEHYETQIQSHEDLSRHHEYLDSIMRIEIMQMKRIDSLKEERIRNAHELNKTLNEANNDLNIQLERSIKLAKETALIGSRKKLWTGALGVAVGFSAATILFLIAK